MLLAACLFAWLPLRPPEDAVVILVRNVGKLQDYMASHLKKYFRSRRRENLKSEKDFV
jgi:hypothetical protein